MNLDENRKQAADNDVGLANQRQAEYMLGCLTEMFEEQNKLLREILEEVQGGRKRDFLSCDKSSSGGDDVS
jgi:hypothetical protein